jgi:CTP synthase (UTP-ammonia lyase)
MTGRTERNRPNADRAPVITVLIDLPPKQRYHAATLSALGHASRKVNVPVEVHVFPTETINERLISQPGAAVVVGPGSPYNNPEGVLDVIQSAREKRIPLVGT